MPFWQRALILLAAMIIVSWLVGYFWNSMLGFRLPDYVSGVVGGLTAVPVWEVLRKYKAKKT